MTAEQLEQIASTALSRSVRIVMHPLGFRLMVSFSNGNDVTSVRTEHRLVSYLEAMSAVDPVGVFEQHMTEMGA